jgi:Family of unknown function (DUF6914)
MFKLSLPNKKRLYMALYPREPSVENPESFHVALLLMRKQPTNEVDDTVRYHVISKINPQREVVWSFVAEHGVRARTIKLVGLVLLGKIPPDVTQGHLEACLRSIPMDQDNPMWNCTHWVMNAIEASSLSFRYRDSLSSLPLAKILAQEQIIPIPSKPPEMILANADRFISGLERNPEAPIPTCSIDGNEITSELVDSMYAYGPGMRTK